MSNPHQEMQQKKRLPAVNQHNKEESFKNICMLFKEVATVYADSLAVIDERTSLSYKELDIYSDRLASYLRSLGVTEGTVVGLSLNNHSMLIIGILGILKSGGVYLPLDPLYPSERLHYMLEDANPLIILTEKLCVHHFSNKSYATLCLDVAWNEIFLNQYEYELVYDTINQENPAYIVYTSGSTGQPKGIVIKHNSLPEIVFSRRDSYLKHPNSLLFGSISFDPSILIVLYTLIAGGKLCICDYNQHVDVEYIIRFMREKSINFLLCVPSLYLMLLEKKCVMLSLQHVSLVAELIPVVIPKLHIHFAPNARLYNEYGPSEYAIGGTKATIYDPQEGIIHEITIGKPLPKVSVYILDEYLHEVATGIKGELCISGIGLAAGYLNKPSLTNEKFISIVLSNTQTVHVYRTGDYGRILPDGNIEFLGRIDHQVKISGYRVELGEVECMISQFPGINEVVVDVKALVGGNKQLIAYFASSDQKNIEEIKAFLTRRLPQYMIPAVFIQIPVFPRTPNGKIDRQVLSKIIGPKEVPVIRPTSKLEKTLVEAWKEVLQCSNIDISKSFFELGGNSLLITRLQVLLNDMYDLSVAITDLFQYPTISQLARHILQIPGSESPLLNKPHIEKHVIANKKNHIFKRLSERQKERTQYG